MRPRPSGFIAASLVWGAAIGRLGLFLFHPVCQEIARYATQGVGFIRCRCSARLNPSEIVMSLMREMLEAGVHFGHQTRYWNPPRWPRTSSVTVTRFTSSTSSRRSPVPGSLEVRQATGRPWRQHPVRRHQVCRARTGGQPKPPAAACPYVDARWLGGHADQLQDGQELDCRLKDMKPWSP